MMEFYVVAKKSAGNFVINKAVIIAGVIKKKTFCKIVDMRKVEVLCPQNEVIINAKIPLITIPIIARHKKMPILDLKFRINLLLSIIIIY